MELLKSLNNFLFELISTTFYFGVIALYIALFVGLIKETKKESDKK